MQICSFIGHKNCPIEIRNCLLHTLEELILDKKVNRFYVGTQGDFDKMVYEVLCDLEKKHKIEVFVVLAYLNRVHEHTYYDVKKTIFPDELTKTPPRFAIRRRNSLMIDKSHYIVSYLNTPLSNTCGNVEEAIRKKKQIINLGDYDIKCIGQSK